MKLHPCPPTPTAVGRAEVRGTRHACTLLVGLLLSLAPSAEAQHSPYTAATGREIKALSAEQVGQYLAGEGMGLALAAELNGYPGPKHVLELAAELELSADQEAAVRSVFAAMKERAAALGEEIVALERRLDRSFGEGRATPEQLRTDLDALGALQAELRFVHLAAHLSTRDLLTEAQRRRYEELRGYGGGAGHHHDPSQHHGGHGATGAHGGGREGG